MLLNLSTARMLSNNLFLWELIMFDELMAENKPKFQKVLDRLKEEFHSVRTGRANPALVEGLMVEAYGNKMPLQQLASISVSEARVLLISVWDASVVKAVESAIRDNQALSLNPAVAGTSIRIALPELTTERRKEYSKSVSAMAEKAKVAMRNIRREMTDSVKKAQKNSELSEDDRDTFLSKVDEATESFIKKVEESLSSKIADIMEI